VQDVHDDLSGTATELFRRLKHLGQRLVADDQLRRNLYVNMQTRFEELDDEVEGIPFMARFEGDIEENGRMVSNYLANPSAQNEEESLEELDEAAR
jgi:hypothetical protein